ncbi:glycosyltransferase family 9 protein [soil metagenome]
MGEPRFPVLFITSTRIGDAVLSSGLIARLVEEAPHASFTIACGPLAAPLFRDLPGLERIIPMVKQPNGMHWFQLWRQVRSRRWGLVLDMRGSGLARVLRAKRRAVKTSASAGASPEHKVMEAARLLMLENDPPSPRLFVGSQHQSLADQLVPKGAPILAMAPAAKWVGKTWPAERFAVVAAELLNEGGPMAGGRLLLLGGEGDRFAAEAVRRVTPRGRTIDLVGRTDLLTAYACLAKARLFIGNDSGLMHMAAAAGAPTLGLFGPSDERLYGPWGPHTRALRGARDLETYKRIDPHLNQQISHMADLPVEWVSTAARSLLRDTQAPLRAAPAAPPSSAKGAAVLG